MRQPRTFAELTPCALNGIVDRGVDLILHGAIAGPTGSHGTS
jgi:hypothetical protein